MQLALTAVLAALAPLAGGVRRHEHFVRAGELHPFAHDRAAGRPILPGVPAFTWTDDTYQESVFRYNMVTVGAGSNADHLNIVQTWGQGQFMRPYGEWEYPFRPGATPYSPWPVPFFNSGLNSFGQNGYGQNGYGQNAYGPNPYGQNFSGQNPIGYGQQPYPAQQGPFPQGGGPGDWQHGSGSSAHGSGAHGGSASGPMGP